MPIRQPSACLFRLVLGESLAIQRKFLQLRPPASPFAFPFARSMRVLVTGASGFIGQRLVQRLVERGDDVACLVRATSKTRALEALGVRLAVGSLTDVASVVSACREAFGGAPPDVVQHLAGMTHATSLAEFLAVNERGVQAVCDAAASYETPPAVVAVSSLAAVGPSAPGEPHTEASPCSPISNYGRSKLAGERVARRFADRLPVSIVRPPVVFGPGDRDGLLLFKTIRRLGFHFVPQMQGLPLSAVYADDLAEALLTVGDQGERCQPDEPEADSAAGVYFAGDPAETSYAEIGRMAAAAMERKVWVVCRRKYPLLPAAWAGDLYGKLTGKAPLLGTDKLREASASGWVCRSNKLCRLGWAPAKPLAERYGETAAWYTEAGWL